MTNADRFKAGIEAVNARDWLAHRAMLASDFTSVDYSTGETISDPDAFVEMQQQNLAPFPDQVLSVTSIAESGNRLFAEILCEATHTGPLPLPTGGLIAATGNRVTVHCAVVCEYDANGLARRTTAYVNPMEIFAQVGGVPGVPTQINLDERTSTTT